MLDINEVSFFYNAIKLFSRFYVVFTYKFRAHRINNSADRRDVTTKETADHPSFLSLFPLFTFRCPSTFRGYADIADDLRATDTRLARSA